MFERIGRGWNLGVTALNILWSDSKLLVFPLLSGVASLMVMISFAAPLYFSANGRELFNNGDIGAALHNVVVYAVLFTFYFMNYFVILFFNSALVACAMKRFQGETPTLVYGFNVAFSRLPQITGWALVSATVGVILRAIEDRSEKVGSIVAAIFGMAWNMMTFFVLPVLVIEGVGPITAIKRSCAVLKNAWGESVGANFGTGLLMFVFSLLALIPGVLGFVIGGPMLVAGICASVLLLLLVALISSAANTIILTALYQYATGNQAPAEFNSGELEAAFARK